MSGVIDTLEREQLRKGIPSFDAGDRVKVHFQVVEGTRRRTQVFEGIVLKRQGSGARETFTVRKQSFGVGVERTFPVHSPKIERIEVAARGDVRRAKLYYLRGRVGRRARVRERQYTGAEAARAAAPEGPFDELGAQEEAPPETIVPEGAEGGPPAEEIPSDAEAKATADAGGEAGQGGDEPPGESAAEPEGDEPSADEPSAEEPSAEDGGQQPEAADEGAPEDRDADQSGS